MEGTHNTAHKVISLITERVGGPGLGGSFYESSFSVLVEQKTDTMILSQCGKLPWHNIAKKGS